jgi:hypothetical protein
MDSECWSETKGGLQVKQDQRGKVIQDFLARQIPRDAKGDPSFAWLQNEVDDPIIAQLRDDPAVTPPNSLLAVFTPEEIVLLVNRALYASDYQRQWHRQWERRKAEELAPLKAKVVEMFHLRKWSEASDEQLRAAKAALLKEKGRDG